MSAPAPSRLRLVSPDGDPAGEHAKVDSPDRTFRGAAAADNGAVLDDSALLAGLRRGEQATAVAFYERAHPIVERTIARLLGARDPDYEDATQVALFELVSTIDRFRGDCPLNAWISIVSARVAYRQIRRRRVERRLFSSAPPEEFTSNLNNMPAAFASRQAIECVKEHLTRMDERRAWTFLLHDAYGYDLKEISQIMGVSLSAAQARLVRGRSELHEKIRRDPDLAAFLVDNDEAVT